MDGILMFKGVSKYRLEGASVDDAIIRGRTDRLRSGLMASLVPILGLLPAALATGLGSDVQRPLATVITCGLSGSALFTLFITPVFYRIFVPPLPESRPAPGVPPAPAEPLPDVSAAEVVGLLEYLHQHGDEEAVVRIADEHESGVCPRGLHRQGGRVAGLRQHPAAHGCPDGRKESASSRRTPESARPCGASGSSRSASSAKSMNSSSGNPTMRWTRISSWKRSS